MLEEVKQQMKDYVMEAIADHFTDHDISLEVPKNIINRIIEECSEQIMVAIEEDSALAVERFWDNLCVDDYVGNVDLAPTPAELAETYLIEAGLLSREAAQAKPATRS